MPKPKGKFVVGRRYCVARPLDGVDYAFRVRDSSDAWAYVVAGDVGDLSLATQAEKKRFDYLIYGDVLALDLDRPDRARIPFSICSQFAGLLEEVCHDA